MLRSLQFIHEICKPLSQRATRIEGKVADSSEELVFRAGAGPDGDVRSIVLNMKY